MTTITAIVTVGPSPQHKHWLPECLESIWAQSRRPDKLIVFDDGAHLDKGQRPDWLQWSRVVSAPWHVGQTDALNFAIAKAETDTVIPVDSDDRLLPGCLEECEAEYNRIGDPWRYYYVCLALGDTGRTQACAGGIALFSRRLWAYLGGYPDVGPGSPDVPFVDLILRYAHGVHPVCEGRPLYWHREHPLNGAKVNLQKPDLWNGWLLLKKYQAEDWPNQDRGWVQGYGFAEEAVSKG